MKVCQSEFREQMVTASDVSLHVKFNFEVKKKSSSVVSCNTRYVLCFSVWCTLHEAFLSHTEQPLFMLLFSFLSSFEGVATFFPLSSLDVIQISNKLKKKGKARL